MRTSAYASLSRFGLVFTFAVGSLLALYSYMQESWSAWLHKKRGHKPYHHLKWTTNATLQLHRLAQEEMGRGVWSDYLPRTKQSEWTWSGYIC
ncbi:hypothetical protein F4824DRAFT_450845 [Ustulina deusta]|nr:hypothetical protein F4824DRAFT_450845 [Ustulina deusta]